jgi:molybdopterin synthase sulfur carrier subunit
MVEVLIPPQLRRLCDGEEAVEVGPGPLGEVLLQLQERFNGVYDRLCQPDGTVRGSVLVLVNDEDVRFLRELQTPVRSGDSVRLIPAFAGG